MKNFEDLSGKKVSDKESDSSEQVRVVTEEPFIIMSPGVGRER